VEDQKVDGRIWDEIRRCALIEEEREETKDSGRTSVTMSHKA